MTPQIRIASNRDSQEGFSLLLVTMLLIFVSSTALIVGTQSINTMREHADVVYRELCVITAESVAAVALEEYLSGKGQLLAAEHNDAVFDFEASKAAPRVWFQKLEPRITRSLPAIEFAAFVSPWAKDGIDNNGDGTVDDPGEQEFYTVRSVAHQGRVYLQLEIVFRVYQTDSEVRKETVAWRQTWPN